MCRPAALRRLGPARERLDPDPLCSCSAHAPRRLVYATAGRGTRPALARIATGRRAAACVPSARASAPAHLQPRRRRVPVNGPTWRDHGLIGPKHLRPASRGGAWPAEPMFYHAERELILESNVT